MGRVETKRATSSESTSTFVSRILNECQHSQGLHARRVKELVAWRSDHKEGFLKDFWTCLLPIFTVFKREPTVERLVKFVVAFVAYRDKEHGNQCDAFLEEFFGILLFSTDATKKAVRLRACQIISEVILRLEDNAEVSDEVWDDVIDCMQRRMQDKIPAVRAYSARALTRFANADGLNDLEDDTVLSAYRKALQFDQNADVRRNVILSMPPSNATAQDIVRHTADVSETVRRSAFLVLAKKFPVQSLSIKQRTSILQRGLHDRKEAVQMECLKMLKDVWLAKCCQGDPIKLLKYLDVETHEAVSESVMLALLKADLIPLQDVQGIRKFMPNNNASTGAVDETKVQPMEAEEALYWRMFISYLHGEAEAKGHDAATTGGAQAAVNAAAASEKNELLEKVLPPTMADYVALVKAHLNAGAHYCFASRQLLLLGKFLDFSDATNRKVAGAFLQDLLRVPAEFGHLETEQDEDVVIGDGLSLGGDKQWAKAVAELAWKVCGGALGEFEKGVSEAVADLGKPCREGGAGVMQWVNCLAVTGLLLENVKSLHQLAGHAIEAQEILNGLLLPAAKHIHSEVQRAAVRCLGLFCIRDQKPSPQAVKQLRLALNNNFAAVQKMASKALFDLSMWHSAATIDRCLCIGVHSAAGIQSQGRSVDEGTEEGDNSLPVLELLAQKLDGDDSAQEPIDERDAGDAETVQSIIAEGFAKLLLQSKVFTDILPMQHSVLAKVIRLYFNEATKGTPRLRQCLSVFFETYASVALEHKICIGKAFIPVMRSEWPGIFGNESGSATTVAAKKKHATTISKFMLQLLHQPLFGGDDRSADTSDNQLDEEAESVEQENSSRREPHVAAVCDEELAIRIACEVARFPPKRSAAAKSYLTMLSKTVCSLEFRQSEQKSVKCMRNLLDQMKDSVAGDKQAIKELESMALRLKALDKTPEESLSDEEIQIILRSMELEDLKLPESFQPETEAVTPAPAPRKGGGKRRPKKSATPESCSPPPAFTPAPVTSVRTQRTSKTTAMAKMRSDLAPSKRAIYASSDEDLVSSSSSSEESQNTDSEFEVETQEHGDDNLEVTEQAVLTEATNCSNSKKEKQKEPNSGITETGSLETMGSVETDENVDMEVTSEAQPSTKKRHVRKEVKGQQYQTPAPSKKKHGSTASVVKMEFCKDTVSEESKSTVKANKPIATGRRSARLKRDPEQN